MLFSLLFAYQLWRCNLKLESLRNVLRLHQLCDLGLIDTYQGDIDTCQLWAVHVPPGDTTQLAWETLVNNAVVSPS